MKTWFSRVLLTLILASTSFHGFGANTPRIRQPFDFDWEFQLGDIEVATAADSPDSDWRHVNVPHDYSAEGDFASTNFSCTGYLPGGVAWYRKRFFVPADWSNKVVSLQFDGVSEKSQVWLNSASIGGHPWAYTTFTLNLPENNPLAASPGINAGLKFGATNVLTVRVDHSAIDDSRFYVGSGIYRHVWLIATEKLHVARDGVFVTTPGATAQVAEVQIQTSIENRSKDANVQLTTDILDPKGHKVGSFTRTASVADSQTVKLDQRIPVNSPMLWSPDSPFLYTAATTVRDGKRITDVVNTTFGIRDIIFDAQSGFLLNGAPTKFKGVCLHHDAGAVGAAVPDVVLERRLRLLKEMGCNAIRTSHNAPAPELLDLCDRLGFLVMDEAFDEWSGSKHKWKTGRNNGTPSLHGSYSEFFEQWADDDMLDMVLRDRNHPSVILWSIGNEVDYPNDPFNRQTAAVLAKDGARLIAAVHRGDTTRPITAGLAAIQTSNPIGLADELDVVGYNYQVDLLRSDLQKYPNRKFVGSEDGMELSYVNLITTNSRVTGQFLWVGFDFLGEAGTWPNHGSGSGLFDTAGFLKTSGELRKALWDEQPMVFAGVRPASRGGFGRGGGRFGALESHWNWADDGRTNLPVEVYSNCKSVELFLNGSPLGVKNTVDAPDHVLRWNVANQPGVLSAIGWTGTNIVQYDLITAGKTARVELVADRTRLAADGEDASNIELRAVDAKGVLVPNADLACTVKVTGGRLLGLDSGNQSDNTQLHSPTRRLYHSREMAIVQSLRGQPGPITVTVSAPGLPESRLVLQSH